MKIQYIQIAFTVIVLFVHNCQCLRILGLFLYQGKSHYTMAESLMKGLAAKGHEVDVVSHFPQQKPILRFNDLSVKGSMPTLVNNMSFDIIQSLDAFGVQKFVIEDAGKKMCDTVLQHPVVQDLKHTTVKYDVVIIELFGGECALGFAHLFRAPSIGITTSVLLPWTNDRFGNPDNPSYIPSYFLSYTPDMTFMQRVLNTVTTVASKWIYHYCAILPEDMIARKYIAADMPPLEFLVNNMSLLLVNSHFSLSGARPTSPNVVEVAGLHINPPKKLNPKFEKIMNESKRGVVYFSMGSMVRSESFPIDRQRILIEALGELPYTIFWKGVRDEFSQPIPDNIRFETWFPQIEILCHPNTKVFITHGGFMGTQEAIYCGVPLVGIPLFGDQDLNIRTFTSMKLARRLEFHNMTKEDIISAVNDVIDNSYRENTAKLSQLFRDRPVSPLDLAIYWIEYVARHKGAPHLKPYSTQLPWYKLHLIDVVIFLLAIAAIQMLLVYKLILFFIRIYTSRKGRNISKLKKKN